MPEILIQCVVVLYERSAEAPGTLQELSRISSERRDLMQRIALLIYDNSRQAQPVDFGLRCCGRVEYVHAAENGGLAAAYNEALTRARRDGTEWLLLFDQDTAPTAAFFSALSEAIESRPPSQVCAAVPKLIQNGRVISPQVIGRLHNVDFPAGASGIQQKPLMVLNSGVCLRVPAVTAIGGFPREYWLDFLDHIVFHRLQAAGGRVLVLPAALEHRLSIVNLESEMSPGRYTGLLSTEWRFIRETGTGGGSAMHRLRLLKRAMSYGVRFRDKSYALKTFKAMLQ